MAPYPTLSCSLALQTKMAINIKVKNLEQMSFDVSLKLIKFVTASYVIWVLFQSKGAALLNDLSPYVFNFVRGTTNRYLLQSGRNGV